MLPTLMNHLWQSTLFAAAAGLLTLALRNYRAPVRYWLWLTASVKFLVPFALLVTLGSHVEWRKAPAPAPIPTATAPLPSVIEQISQPFPPLPANTPRTPINLPAVLLCLWSCGFSIVVFGWARQWLRLRTALRSASPLPLNLPIRVMSSPARLEPGVFGVFRPVLLLPEGIADRLSPAQWDAILAHELCHVRRRDNLTASIHMAVEAILWFHPLVWWIGKRLLAERERACDEAVLLAAHHPQDYAEGILSVCKLYAESPLVCVSGVTGSNLKKRIRAIMTEPIASDLHFARKLALALAGIAALVIPITIGLINAPAIRAQSPSAPIPKFEVVSIKPSVCEDAKGRGATGSSRSSPGRLTLDCYRVIDLIRTAYSTFADGQQRRGPGIPIEKAPAWIDSAHYTVNATTAGSRAESLKADDAPSQAIMKGPMLQAVLEDRFKLKIHRDTRETPVYALTVAKGGPKNLPPAQPGRCITVDADHPAPPPLPDKPQPQRCGAFYPSTTNEGIDIPGTTMAELAREFSAVSDRPVIDKTGIAGVFDLHLEIASQPNPPEDTPNREIMTRFLTAFDDALQKLGLKLEDAKAPGEFLIIDSVERPTED
jgi:bla regulator protein blaR1